MAFIEVGGLLRSFWFYRENQDNKTLFEEAEARLNRTHTDSSVGEKIIITIEEHCFVVLDQQHKMNSAQAIQFTNY